MKANEGRFRLRDLLSVPIQRVLKYHLLLKVRPFASLTVSRSVSIAWRRLSHTVIRS